MARDAERGRWASKSAKTSGRCLASLKSGSHSVDVLSVLHFVDDAVRDPCEKVVQKKVAYLLFYL